jgi:hypothetical protein
MWGAINDSFGFFPLMMATMIVTVTTMARSKSTVDCAWAIIALVIGLIDDMSHVASANDGYTSVNDALHSDVDDDPIVTRTRSDVTSIIVGEAHTVGSAASYILRKNGEFFTIRSTLNLPFVNVDTPGGIISCDICPQDGNLQSYADRSYCGFRIQDESLIHPVISNASSFTSCR